MGFFSILRMAKPLFSGIPLKAIIIIIALLGLFAGYTYVNNKFEALDAAKITLAQNETTITNLQTDLKNTAKSDKLTLIATETLTTKVAEVKIKAKKQSTDVKNKVKVIEESNATEEEKEIQVSSVYLDNLYTTYCSIDPANCL